MKTARALIVIFALFTHVTIFAAQALQPVMGEWTVKDLETTLMGKSQADVIRLIGKPTGGEIGDSAYWSYTWPNPAYKFEIVDDLTGFRGRRLLVFFKNAHVVKVNVSS